jgi:hypothetical protein
VLATRGAIEISPDKLVGAGIFDVVHWPMMAEEIAIALVYGAVAKKAETTTLRRATAATS